MSEDRLAALERRLTDLERRHELLKGFIVPALWDAHDRLYERVPPTVPPPCLACDTSPSTVPFRERVDVCAFGGGRLVRLECPSCGCVFGPIKYLETPPALIEADYRLLYASYSEGDSTEHELRAFEALRPRRDGVYLNWGSGARSASVERLRARGHDVWGYEPHADVDSPFVARRREEISARFDGIFSNNVIEHLVDPAAQFREFHRLLKNGGRMAHASPCYAWSFAYSRFHVFFPLGEAAARLAERSGFTLSAAVDDGDFRVRVFDAV
jgi:SAM-dependent methyltransferase